MAGARTATDQNAGPVNEGKQRSDGTGAGNVVLTILFPPVFLVGIAGNLDGIIFLAQMEGELAPVFQRPDAGGKARAGKRVGSARWLIG